MNAIHLAVAGSTMNEARSRVESRAALPLAVIAAEQLAGRGRLGRAWTSPPGGVWLTLAWPCARPDLSFYQPLALLAALTLHDAVIAALAPVLPALDPSRLTIKWPNDLLLDDAKVAGILCESFSHQGRTVMLIGIGLNADFDAAQLPADLPYRATTLRTALALPPGALAPAPLATTLARKLSSALADFESTGCTPAHLARLSSRLAFLQKPVRFREAAILHPPGLVSSPRHASAQDITGILAGVDSRGHLILSTPTGPQIIAAGVLQPLDS